MQLKNDAPLGLLFAGLALWVTTYGLLLADLDQLRRFAGSERPVEWLGATFFLAAAAVCFVVFWRSSRRVDSATLRSRTAFLLLGILFFVAFGEEVSWGQHILGFEAPEGIRRHNVQRELNLHNLTILDTFTTAGEKKTGLGLLLNSNRLFDYFMFSLFLLAPLGAARSSRIRSGLQRLSVPLPPVTFGGLLMLNLVATIFAEAFLVDGRYGVHIAVSEIRECNYAGLCCLASLHWLSERGGRQGAASGLSGRAS